jgi:hypothetical protein
MLSGSDYDNTYDSGHDPVKNIKWEKEFTWWPVRINGKVIWLKTVYITHEWNTEHGLRWVKRYGTILDVLREVKNGDDKDIPWGG